MSSLPVPLLTKVVGH